MPTFGLSFKNDSMQENQGNLNAPDLTYLGIHTDKVQYQLTPQQLMDATVEKGLGRLTHNGTLSINTGRFTERSPEDRFIVKDAITEDHVWWGPINKPFGTEEFHALKERLVEY